MIINRRVPHQDMAKYDTERFLRFVLNHNPDSNDEDFHYIDLAAALTAVNRKSFRQGKVYQVANVTIHDSQGDAFVKFCTAPNNQSTRRAWNIGFKNWKKQRAQALQGLEGQQTGKYSDFKVFLNDDHITDPDSAHKFESIPGGGSQLMWIGDLRPTDIENNKVHYGEWDYSKFYEHHEYDTAGAVDEAWVCLMGANKESNADMQSVSLIDLYEEILNPTVADPAVGPALENTWYGRMFVGANDEVLEDIDGENDMPGYSPSLLLGGPSNLPKPYQRRICHIASTYSPVAQVGGFSVPCGLLCIETKSETSDNEIGITIEMVPGDYNGLMAEDM